MVKTARRRPDKQAEIVKIAEGLFLTQGYADTTIDDILTATGLSKGGFYHYFKSKEDVLSESIRLLMNDFLAEIEPLVADPTLNGLEKLKCFMRLKTEFQQSRREFAVYLGMLMKSDFTLYKCYLLQAQNYLDPLARILEQGRAEGLFAIQYPRETADILLRAATSFPQSALLADCLADEAGKQRYALSLKQVIAGTLGIDVRELC